MVLKNSTVFPKNLHYLPEKAKKKILTVFFLYRNIKSTKEVTALKITYNLEKLKSIVDNICEFTNISISITDTKYNTIYNREMGNDSYCHKVQENEIGRLKCHHSDIDMYKKCAEEKQAVSYICHAGVIDTAIPILKDGILAGFIMLGRIRLKSSIDTNKYLYWTDNPDKIAKHYKKLTYLTQTQLEAIINLISHILFENAIEIDYDKFINFATDYIENNLSEDLNIERLCRVFEKSKNAVYENFHKFYNCTVNEYITKRRIETAKSLLINTKNNIEQISETVGFYNYTYFSKIFKKYTGVSPRNYRKHFIK